MNIGRACGIFINIDSENFTEDEKLVAIRDVLKEMVTYNGITKNNILKAFRWFFDLAVEEVTADAPEKEKEDVMPEYERLKERDRAKKPEVDDEMGYFICPACKSAITYTDEKETHKFCLKCGQRIDWSEEEEHEN